MGLPGHSSDTVIVLPAAAHEAASEEPNRRWLSRSRLQRADVPAEALVRTLVALGIEAPTEGLASLRFWGQTGARPSAWVTAADPVYLEARLDHLCLWALTEDELPEEERATLFRALQDRLAADRDYAFARIDSLGYLKSDRPLATAAVSADLAHGGSPEKFLPEGAAASSHDALQGEIQMCLHDLELNRERAEAGRATVNALWLWGGGSAPPETLRSLPPLFADDPLFRGYWLSCGADAHAWPGSIAACRDAADGRFVAVVPGPPRRMDGCLEEIRRLVDAGRCRNAVLLFRDGMAACPRRLDRWRFWRRSPLFAPGGEP